MADEEEITVEGDEETTVEDGDTIVTTVVENPSESTPVEVTVDFAERITRLESQMETVQTVQMEQGFAIESLRVVDENQTETIEAVAEVTADIAEEVVEKESSDTETVDDAPTSKVHRWWRERQKKLGLD